MGKRKESEAYRRWKAERKNVAKDDREPAHHRADSGDDDENGESGDKARIAQAESLTEILPDIVRYPLNGDGLIVLVAGSVFFAVAGFFGNVPIIGLLISIFIGGYLSAYMMKIIKSSARGEMVVPDFPEVTNFWDDILRPIILMCGTVAICLSPAIYYYFARPDSSFISLILILLFVAGLLYLPMALITVSLFNSLMALAPQLVFPAVRKISTSYAIALLFLVIILFIRVLAGKFLGALPIPFVGGLIKNFVFLYLLMVLMHVLGLIYYVNRDKLNWL